jgi:hypothetical protein
MSIPFVVRAVVVEEADIVPGRFSEAGLVELAAALGGPSDPDADPWEALSAAFRSMSTQALGERLLEAVLLKPPIPAGCEALLHAMRDPAHPPWVDHEVPEDRFQLWYCHLLVHRVFPDVYPKPALRRVELAVWQLDAAARAPGRRSPPRDRTAFFARLLQDRPGVNPVVGRHGADADAPAEWSYDVVWATVFGEQARVDVSDVPLTDSRAAAGVPPVEGQVLRHKVEGWLAPQWLGDLAVGQQWLSSAHIDPITTRR